jgi:hypothetical protein
MAEKFTPSWVSCLDESMSIWFNKWTCPGWVFCPRKPHPFGNEWHTICCGESGILHAIELVEGKDHPREIPDPPTDKHGKTVGLLLRLCKHMYCTGKVVILDSGFCVLQGIIELKKVGVFASALIKKRRYWPKYIPGDVIDQKLKEVEVGTTTSLKGTLDELPYDIFCLKEPDYVMKIMSTYGGLVPLDNQPFVKRKYKALDGSMVETSFQYDEPFANHFRYRHAVDDHNNLRHAVPSIEGTWVTQRWPIRVFCFLLAVAEVNCYLAYKYFVWNTAEETPTLHQFRRRLAKSFIYNEYFDQEQVGQGVTSRTRTIICHDIKSAPGHATKFLRGKWIKNAKYKFQQMRCSTKRCKNQTRFYCACEVGVWRCRSCHVKHVLAVGRGN